jgi:hypothetical protein
MLLKISVDTLKRFAQSVSQLYEQGAEVGSVRADEGPHRGIREALAQVG